MGSPASRVRVELEDGVATVLIDNPPANTLAQQVIDELQAAVEGLERDGTVRAVVLASDLPGIFLAGGEISELLAAVGDASAVDHHVASTRRLFDALASLPQPVVAAVDGHAVGGGLEVLLCCDLVVASATARFGAPEVRLGLIPGAGGTQRLARRAGVAAALDLVLTGRLIDAEAAAAMGVITRVVQPGEVRRSAAEVAARLAALPAGAVQAAKRAVLGGVELSLSDGLELERREFVARLATDEAREGLRAFLDRPR